LAGGLNAYQYAPNPISWIDPHGLDTYVVNRDLAAFGDSARPRWNVVTHTFAATTDANGSIVHTYSWGNEANLKGWNLDQSLDMRTAKDAISAGIAERVGGPEMDHAVAEAYRQLDKKENDHSNLILFNNCKTETQKLLGRAKKIMKAR
jgi:uncharacterized protein RhaS with RHS repeats